MEYNQNNIGQNIRMYRTHFKETQKELADIIHVTKNYISMIENGDRIPSVDILQTIANHYHISIEQLMENYDSRQDITTADFSISWDELFGIIEIIFPVVYTESAKEDNLFKEAYQLHRKILNILKRYGEISTELFEKCSNLYEQSWDKSKTIESVANVLSLMFLLCSMMDQSGDDFFEKFKTTKQSGNNFLKDYYLRKTNNQEHLKFRKLFAEANYEDMFASIRILKHNSSWSELADYYLALHYLVGMACNGKNPDINISTGMDLIFAFVLLDNKYCGDFYENVYSRFSK